MAEQMQSREGRLGPGRSQSLADVLDRILEKGLVVAGDIRVNLADVELLTIQIRLVVCSIDKAAEIGLDWWRTDPRLSSRLSDGDTPALHDRLDRLDRRLASLEEVESGGGASGGSDGGSDGERRRSTRTKEDT